MSLRRKRRKKGFSVAERFIEEAGYPTVDQAISKRSKEYEPNYKLAIWKEESHGHTIWMVAFVDEEGEAITDMPYGYDVDLGKAVAQVSRFISMEQKHGIEYD